MNESQCFCDECEKAMAYAEARIIKMLEQYERHCGCEVNCANCFEGTYFIDKDTELSRLIKGEEN